MATAHTGLDSVGHRGFQDSGCQGSLRPTRGLHTCHWIRGPLGPRALLNAGLTSKPRATQPAPGVCTPMTAPPNPAQPPRKPQEQRPQASFPLQSGRLCRVTDSSAAPSDPSCTGAPAPPDRCHLSGVRSPKHLHGGCPQRLGSVARGRRAHRPEQDSVRDPALGEVPATERLTTVPSHLTRSKCSGNQGKLAEDKSRTSNCSPSSGLTHVPPAHPCAAVRGRGLTSPPPPLPPPHPALPPAPSGRWSRP